MALVDDDPLREILARIETGVAETNGRLTALRALVDVVREESKKGDAGIRNCIFGVRQMLGGKAAA